MTRERQNLRTVVSRHKRKPMLYISHRTTHGHNFTGPTLTAQKRKSSRRRIRSRFPRRITTQRGGHILDNSQSNSIVDKDNSQLFNDLGFSLVKTLDGRLLMDKIQSNHQVKIADIKRGDHLVQVQDTKLYDVDSGSVFAYSLDDVHQQLLAKNRISNIYTSVCSFENKKGDMMIVSGSNDNAVRVWDTKYRTHTVLKGHKGMVLSVCSFENMNGDMMIVSGSKDNTVRVWDAETGEQVSVLEGHKGMVLSVCSFKNVSSDVRIVSSSKDNTVRVWDAETGTQVSVLEGHNGIVYSLYSFENAEGDMKIVSGCDDNIVRVWDVDSGSQESVLNGHTGTVRSVCSSESVVPAWDKVSGGSNFIVDGDFVGQGGVLAKNGGIDELWDSAPELWDSGARFMQNIVEGKEVKQGVVWKASWNDKNFAIGLTSASNFAIPCTSNNFAIQCTKDCIVNIYENGIALLNKSGNSHSFGHYHELDEFEVSVRNTERENVVSYYKNGVLLHKSIIPKETFPLVAYCSFCSVGARAQDVRMLVLRPSWIVSGSEDNTVRVWDAESKKQVSVLEGHQDMVLSVCSFVNAEGCVRIVSGSKDNTVRVWDAKSSTQLSMLNGHDGIVYSLCSFKNKIVSGNQANTVSVWDAESRDTVLVLGDGDELSMVVYKPDDNTVERQCADFQVSHLSKSQEDQYGLEKLISLLDNIEEYVQTYTNPAMVTQIIITMKYLAEYISRSNKFLQLLDRVYTICENVFKLIVDDKNVHLLTNLTNCRKYVSCVKETLFQDLVKEEVKKLSDGSSKFDVIGNGADGIVYKVPVADTFVAVKVVADEKEGRLMCTLKHPNIISVIYGPEQINSNVYFALELCDQSLKDKINASSDTNWPLHERLDVLIQIATGMQYLVDNQIYHRDLKLGNVLLKKTLENREVVKITDFGISKISTTTDRKNSIVGTNLYMAPEMSPSKDSHGEAYYNPILTDIHSFGILMWFVLSGYDEEGWDKQERRRLLPKADQLTSPWDNRNYMKKLQNALKQNTEEVPTKWKDEVDIRELVKIIEKCWNTEPKERYQSFKDIHSVLRLLRSNMVASKYQLALNQLTVDKNIGKGSFGKVYQVTVDNTNVAFKVGTDIALTETECDWMKTLKHHNIVSVLYGPIRGIIHKQSFQYTGDRPKDRPKGDQMKEVAAFALELCDQSLQDKIDASGTDTTNWPLHERLDVLIQIATGMQYLVDTQIYHRDLKPQNVLLKKIQGNREVVKITDFGLSRNENLDTDGSVPYPYLIRGIHEAANKSTEDLLKNIRKSKLNIKQEIKRELSSFEDLLPNDLTMDDIKRQLKNSCFFLNEKKWLIKLYKTVFVKIMEDKLDSRMERMKLVKQLDEDFNIHIVDNVPYVYSEQIPITFLKRPLGIDLETKSFFGGCKRGTVVKSCNNTVSKIGLAKGDVLVSVNHMPCADSSLSETMEMISNAGLPITLQFEQKSSGHPPFYTVTSTQKRKLSDVGTPVYKAPEMESRIYDPILTDIFSFGILMWSVLSGQKPYYDVVQQYRMQLPALMICIKNGERPNIDTITTVWKNTDCLRKTLILVQIIQKCWAKDPKDRYESFNEIKNNIQSVKLAFATHLVQLPVEELRKHGQLKPLPELDLRTNEELREQARIELQKRSSTPRDSRTNEELREQAKIELKKRSSTKEEQAKFELGRRGFGIHSSVKGGAVRVRKRLSRSRANRWLKKSTNRNYKQKMNTASRFKRAHLAKGVF